MHRIYRFYIVDTLGRLFTRLGCLFHGLLVQVMNIKGFCIVMLAARFVGGRGSWYWAVILTIFHYLPVGLDCLLENSLLVLLGSYELF